MSSPDLREINNWEHDPLFKAKRVTDAGSDDQTIIDEAIAGTTYVGRAGRGVDVVDSGWFLTKIVEAGTDTTITHAVDTWSNRSLATYS